jgi:hypothetical protein
MLTMWLGDARQEVQMDTTARFSIPGIVFLLTLASGVWLSRSGKPLNTGIFTVHKLIALGAVIAAAIQTYHVLKNAEIQAILIALIILIGLCVVALFITGALMSANKPAHSMLLIIHKLSSFAALIVGVATMCLLAGRTR